MDWTQGSSAPCAPSVQGTYACYLLALTFSPWLQEKKLPSYYTATSYVHQLLLCTSMSACPSGYAYYYYYYYCCYSLLVIEAAARASSLRELSIYLPMYLHMCVCPLAAFGPAYLPQEKKERQVQQEGRREREGEQEKSFSSARKKKKKKKLALICVTCYEGRRRRDRDQKRSSLIFLP